MYFPPTDWLCSMCWKALEREYLSSDNSYRAEKTLPHFHLLSWHEDNRQLLKFFIDSLKQGGPDFIFKRLGLEMFSRFMSFDLWNKKTSPVFAPAPSKSKIKRDHAFMLAQALSFYFGGELRNCLKRAPGALSQKRKSRRDRAFTQMSCEGAPPGNRPVVFVDDVLTTGSTARAAFQALSRPQSFFIFTLAWKRPPPKTNDEDENLF